MIDHLPVSLKLLLIDATTLAEELHQDLTTLHILAAMCLIPNSSLHTTLKCLDKKPSKLYKDILYMLDTNTHLKEGVDIKASHNLTKVLLPLGSSSTLQDLLYSMLHRDSMVREMLGLTLPQFKVLVAETGGKIL